MSLSAQRGPSLSTQPLSPLFPWPSETSRAPQPDAVSQAPSSGEGNESLGKPVFGDETVFHFLPFPRGAAAGRVRVLLGDVGSVLRECSRAPSLWGWCPPTWHVLGTGPQGWLPPSLRSRKASVGKTPRPSVGGTTCSLRPACAFHDLGRLHGPPAPCPSHSPSLAQMPFLARKTCS